MNILSQVVARFKENGDSRETHLGCIRIDPPRISRPLLDKSFAFYTFRVVESSDTRNSHCSINYKFLVVSGSYGPDSVANNDLLFFFKDHVFCGKTKGRKSLVWKVLVPSDNNHSMTGTVVNGEEALDMVFDLVSGKR